METPIDILINSGSVRILETTKPVGYWTYANTKKEAQQGNGGMMFYVLKRPPARTILLMGLFGIFYIENK